MLLEFEGIDGCGKTTQCRLLQNWFGTELKEKAIVVKDLDATEIGRHLKTFLHSRSDLRAELEACLFLAAKAALFHSLPELLEEYQHVIWDRGIGSFLSYFQARGLNPALLEGMINAAAPPTARPRTIFLEVPVQVAMKRLETREGKTRFDLMGYNFFKEQAAKQKELAHQRGWHSLNGCLSEEELHFEVLKIVRRMR